MNTNGNNDQDLPHICDRLNELSGELHWATVQILSATVQGELANTFAGPAMYCSRQGKRIVQLIEKNSPEDIDVIAWSTRCLFETYLFLGVVLMHEHDDAIAMIEKWVDHGYSKVGSAMNLLESHSEEACKVLLQELKDLGRPPNQRERAKQLGEDDEYQQFYCLLCEYTHPSGYLLCGNPSDVFNPDIVREFGRRAVYYLQKILNGYNYIRDCGLSE